MNAACRQIRRDILQASFASGHGHIPTSYSVVEILYAVYGVMRHDPSNPEWPERDLFVLSKGHASLALYCNLARLGYFPVEAVRTFGGYGSDFGCHAHRLKVRGVEASTGSLGHGIGIAVGMAMAQKLRRSGRKVYTVIGDGESNEGSVWEAIMVARHQGLDPLTVLYDNNMSQGRSLPIHEPAARFRAFGCEVHEVDGHDVEVLREVLLRPQGTVRVIVANTRKGYGSSTLQDYHAWHRRSPTADELPLLLEELDAAAV